MNIIRNNERKFKQITDGEKIDHVIKNYVDLNNLHIKINDDSFKIQFLDYQDNNIFHAILPIEIKEGKYIIYTLSKRYIEFDVEFISFLEGDYPDNSCKFKIHESKIAVDNRKVERFNFKTDQISVKDFTLAVAMESEFEIIRNMTVKILLSDIEKKLSNYSFAKVYLQNDKNIPAEVKFVIETDILLYIKNNNKLRSLIENNHDFFLNRQELKKEFRTRIISLESNYHSILIQPIEYLTISGYKLILGHIMVAQKDEEISEETILEIREHCDDVFDKISSIHQKTFPVKGEVVNISSKGIKIKVPDSEMVQNLISQKTLMFNLIFRYQTPIKISGEVIYIIKDNQYFIGIDFTASRYGINLNRLIEINIKNLIALS